MWDERSLSSRIDAISVVGMKAEFNENMFGFCWNDNNIDYLRSKGFRVWFYFPTLREEARLGFDASFETGLYDGVMMVQHKIPEYIQRSKETYQAPFFRFGIRNLKKTRQHNLLVGLEDLGFQVFYVAPKFLRSKELLAFHENGTLLQESVKFSPKALGRVSDYLEHSVYYQPDGSDPELRSEPAKIPAVIDMADTLMKSGKLLLRKQDIVELSHKVNEQLMSQGFRLERPKKVRLEPELEVSETFQTLRKKAGVSTLFYGRPENVPM
jgi:hypothetical protein